MILYKLFDSHVFPVLLAKCKWTGTVSVTLQSVSHKRWLQTRCEELGLKFSRVVTLARHQQYPLHPLHASKTSSPNWSFPWMPYLICIRTGVVYIFAQL